MSQIFEVEDPFDGSIYEVSVPDGKNPSRDLFLSGINKIKKMQFNPEDRENLSKSEKEFVLRNSLSYSTNKESLDYANKYEDLSKEVGYSGDIDKDYDVVKAHNDTYLDLYGLDPTISIPDTVGEFYSTLGVTQDEEEKNAFIDVVAKDLEDVDNAGDIIKNIPKALGALLDASKEAISIASSSVADTAGSSVVGIGEFLNLLVGRLKTPESLPNSVRAYGDSTLSAITNLLEYRVDEVSNLLEDLPDSKKSKYFNNFSGSVLEGSSSIAAFLLTAPIKGLTFTAMLGSAAFEAGEDYKRTQNNKGLPINEKELLKVMGIGLFAGIPDILSNKLMISRLFKNKVGKTGYSVNDFTRDLAKTSTFEGFTEVSQDLWRDFAAKFFVGYDQDRDMTEEKFNTFLVSFFSAGVTGGLGKAAQKVFQRVTSKNGVTDSLGKPLEPKQLVNELKKLDDETINDVHNTDSELRNMAFKAKSGDESAAINYNEKLVELSGKSGELIDNKNIEQLNADTEALNISQEAKELLNIKPDDSLRLRTISTDIDSFFSDRKPSVANRRPSSAVILDNFQSIQKQLDDKLLAIEKLSNKKDEASLKQAIRVFDDISSRLPTEIRTKLKGLRGLLSSPASNRDKFLKNRLGKANNIISEHYTAKAYNKINDIISKEVPKTQKGKQKLSKRRTLETQRLMSRIGQIYTLDKDLIDSQIVKLENEASSENITEKRNDEIIEEINLLNKFGSLGSKTTKKTFSSNDLRNSIKALEELEFIRSNGVSQYQAIKEARAEKYKQDKENALKAILGNKTLMSGNEINQLNKTRGPISGLKKLFSDFSDNSQSLFFLFNKIVNDKSKQGQSFLDKEYGEKVFIAENNKFTGITRETDKLRRFIFNDLYSGLKTGQIERTLRKGSEVVDETGIFFEKEIEGLGVERRQQSFSKNSAIKIYMLSKDSSLSKTFEKMGITDSSIEQVKAFIGENGVKLGDFLLSFYDGYYDGINEVFEQQEGYTLDKTSNYSPVRRVVDAKIGDESVLSSDFASIGTPVSNAKNNSLRNRIANTNEILFEDVLNEFSTHVEMMEHYKNFRGIEKSMQAILRSKDVQNAVKQVAGNAAASALNRQIDSINSSAYNSHARISWMDKIRTRVVTSTLGMNPSIFIKQLTSIPAYANAIPTKDFLKGTADFWRDPVGNSRILLDSEYIKQRMSEGYERDLRVKSLNDNVRNLLGTGSLTNRAMFLIRMGDVGAIVTGGWSVYKYHFDRLTKEGDSQAHEKAMFEFEKATATSQQSSRTSDLSNLQKGGSLMKIFTMYMTAPMSYMRITSAAIRDYRKGRISRSQLAKTAFIFWVLLPNVFQAAANGFLFWVDDDEQGDELLRRHIAATVIGPLNGVVIFGDIFETVVNEITGGPDFLGGSTTPVQSALDKNSRNIAKLFSQFSNQNWSQDDIDDSLNAVTDLLSVSTGLPISNVKKQAERMNEALFEPNEKYRLQKFLGYSDYALAERNINKSRKDSSYLAWNNLDK